MVTNSTFPIEFNTTMEKGFQFPTPESDNWYTTKGTWELVRFLFTNLDILWDPAWYDGKVKGFFDELGLNLVHDKRDVFEDATFEWARSQGVTKIACK